jgi:hypothetical protein
MRAFSRKTLVVALSTMLLAACGGSGGGGTASVSGSGSLNLGVTDAPVDGASAVVVKFMAVQLKPENGDVVTIALSPAKSIDLLALAGGTSAALLEDHTVAAGKYEWIRLLIEAEENQVSSYIDLQTGARYPLFVPSGSETGLKLVRGFTVAVGGANNFTIDFDLRKSVVAPPGQAPNYFLKPALRLVDNLQVGRIAGVVASALVTEGCTPFVYAYAGADVMPDDLDAALAPDVDPLISVPVELDAASGEYRYRISFLEAGPYTLSFTCDGGQDTPEGNELLVFMGVFNATVVASQTTTVPFAVP